MSVASVIIIGAGQAGVQVASSLRQEGFQGEVTLIGDEAGLPYQRPPLSKAYLLGKIAVTNLRFRAAEYYAEQRITLLNDEVLTIDRANFSISLASGNSLKYEHLVLAVGARNRPLPVPGAQLDGVFGLKTVADADALIARLKDCKHVVVIGAGFIGLEFAAVASALGISVTVIEAGERLMARAVSTEMSQAFLAAHEAWGVRFQFQQSLMQINGIDGKVSEIETADGRKIPADLVVFGIGVLPNIALAAQAGLTIDHGVKVDAELLTNDPAISAIGDVATFPSIQVGRHIRLESVQNAMDQARTVAARLVGKPAPYQVLPWFWSDQRDLKLQIAGINEGTDHKVILGSAEARQLAVLNFRSDQLIAVETLNRPVDHMVARRVLASAIRPTAAQASAADFDFKAWEQANK